jgi:hypothetical protein
MIYYARNRETKENRKVIKEAEFNNYKDAEAQIVAWAEELNQQFYVIFNSGKDTVYILSSLYQSNDMYYTMERVEKVS